MPVTACMSTLPRRCLTLTIPRDKKLEAESLLQVAIMGDIYHSRVARSAINLLSKFGARITLSWSAESCRS